MPSEEDTEKSVNRPFASDRRRELKRIGQPLCFVPAAEERHLDSGGFADGAHLFVAAAQIIQPIESALLPALHVGQAQIGEYVDLGDAAVNGIAEIVIGQAGAALQHQRHIDGVSNFLKTVKRQARLGLVRAVPMAMASASTPVSAR